MNPVDHPIVRAAGSVMSRIDWSRGVVIGVSGGADSVALARSFLHLQPRDRLLVIAHLDHGLREGSARDADWVRSLGETLQRPVVSERLDVRKLSQQSGAGLEETARHCRYRFLASVAAQAQCRLIAVAHTASDQAETILHQLLRGTGLAGLRGMPVTRDLGAATLIRPFLNVTRADVLGFLKLLGQPYLEDETNLDQSLTRNRIRQSLLPELRRQFNPRVDEALCRLGEQAGDAYDLLEESARILLREAVIEAADGQVRIDALVLRSARPSVVRESFRLLFSDLQWPRQRMGFAQWDGLARLAQTSQSSKAQSLPDGITADYRRGVITLARR